MSFDEHKVMLYRNQPDGRVAEIRAIRGCYARMPTREKALVEFAAAFRPLQRSTRNASSRCSPTNSESSTEAVVND
jgi:hypothetical protein